MVCNDAIGSFAFGLHKTTAYAVGTDALDHASGTPSHRDRIFSTLAIHRSRWSVFVEGFCPSNGPNSSPDAYQTYHKQGFQWAAAAFAFYSQICSSRNNGTTDAITDVTTRLANNGGPPNYSGNARWSAQSML